LNIYNTYSIAGGSIESLQGKKLIEASESLESIKLLFNDRVIITIGMTPKDFNGPEALQLLRDGFPAIVWN
jgi:hypothetical protein